MLLSSVSDIKWPGCVFSRSSLCLCVAYHFDYHSRLQAIFQRYGNLCATGLYDQDCFGQPEYCVDPITVKKEMGTLLILTIQKFKVFISFKFIEVLIYSWIFPFFKAIVNWCVTSSSACRWCIFKSYWFVQVDSVFCYFAEIVDHDRLVGISKVYYPVISSHGCFCLPSLTLPWVCQCDYIRWLVHVEPALHSRIKLIWLWWFTLFFGDQCSSGILAYNCLFCYVFIWSWF